MTPVPPQIGLTWDHPRGYAALTAAAAQVEAELGYKLLHWDRQPLEGFESHPIGELAARHDLLVLDHPHIGEAVALDCLVPLEDLFTPAQIDGWRARTIGRAMDSYFWADRHWALPLDVATQVMASRPDLLRAPPPTTWDEVIRLSERHSVALAVAGPHAALHLFAICAALGHPPAGDDLVPQAPGMAAWRILARLYARAPAGTAQLNPIGLLDAMARTDAIALVPLVYGYVNYAAIRPGLRQVAFDDAPRAISGGRRGSILGGTGIALTRRATVSQPLLDHLAWLMSEPAQRQFIPDHAGQPSARTAWQDVALDANWGGFYRRTAATVADAAVRPRHDGYIAFQSAAAALIRAALEARADGATTLQRLRAIWRDGRCIAASAHPTTEGRPGDE